MKKILAQNDLIQKNKNGLDILALFRDKENQDKLLNGSGMSTMSQIVNNKYNINVYSTHIILKHQEDDINKTYLLSKYKLEKNYYILIYSQNDAKINHDYRITKVKLMNINKKMHWRKQLWAQTITYSIIKYSNIAKMTSEKN